MPRSFNKLYVLVILVSANQASFSQDFLKTDLELIRNERMEKTDHQKSVRPYIYSANTPAYTRFNPVNMVFGGLLFFYQNALSQQFSATCLYHPSCSEFSKQSISRYGLLKGIFLSSDRIMRCNRIAATSIHPIRIENNRVSDPVLFYRLKE